MRNQGGRDSRRTERENKNSGMEKGKEKGKERGNANVVWDLAVGGVLVRFPPRTPRRRTRRRGNVPLTDWKNRSTRPRDDRCSALIAATRVPSRFCFVFFFLFFFVCFFLGGGYRVFIEWRGRSKRWLRPLGRWPLWNGARDQVLIRLGS